MQLTPADVALLTGEAGEAAIGAAAALLDARVDPVTAATRLRRDVGDPRLAALALDQAGLRRRARAKLSDADRLLLTDDALQQATAWAVADHRADSMRGAVVWDATVGAGGDAGAVARVAQRWVGSDLDPVRVMLARHNLAVSGAPDAAVVVADALRLPARGVDVVLADPGRRTAAGRIARPADYEPPLDALAAAVLGGDGRGGSRSGLGRGGGRPALVVKVAPGLDPAAAPWAREIEVVSLDGSVREAVLRSERMAPAWPSGLAVGPGDDAGETPGPSGWIHPDGRPGPGGTHGSAATLGSTAAPGSGAPPGSAGSPSRGGSGLLRRATVLRSHPPAGRAGCPGDPVTRWSVSSLDPEDGCPVRPADRAFDAVVFEPDGAVVRAGLVRQLGTRHGLSRPDEHLAYLTGPEAVDSPALRGFAVLEVMRVREADLVPALRRHDAGSVEVLSRGVDVDPATLRRRLRRGLGGTAALAILLARIGDSRVAVLARPLPRSTVAAGAPAG